MAKKIPKPVNKMFQRLALFGGGLFIIGLVLTATDWRKSSKLTADADINIKTIDGNAYITTDTVIKIIRRDTRQDLNTILIGNLNIESIELALRKNPFVLDAEVYVDSRNQIHIDIEQREPIVRIMDAEGRNYYLDKTGERMPVSNNAVGRVLVATGYLPPYRKEYQKSSVHKLTSLYVVAKYIYEDDFLRPLIEQIEMNKGGEMTLVPKLGHHLIEFGTDERLEEKFKYLKIFYKEALPYHGWEKYKKVNLKYKRQVVGVKKGETQLPPPVELDSTQNLLD